MTVEQQAQHTPGPWSTEEDSADILAPGGKVVGSYYAQEADGELMAAAPDLLAELQEIIDGWAAIEDGKVKMRRLTAWEEERLAYARAVVRRAKGGQS